MRDKWRLSCMFVHYGKVQTIESHKSPRKQGWCWNCVFDYTPIPSRKWWHVSPAPLSGVFSDYYLNWTYAFFLFSTQYQQSMFWAENHTFYLSQWVWSSFQSTLCVNQLCYNYTGTFLLGVNHWTLYVFFSHCCVLCYRFITRCQFRRWVYVSLLLQSMALIDQEILPAHNLNNLIIIEVKSDD